jgi:hypothetical protein
VARRRSADDIPIRDYVDMRLTEADKRNEQRFNAQEKAVNAALASADKAKAASDDNAEKWRASANEWRGAMSDRDRELPSRREVDAARAGLDERIRRLEDEAKATQGRSQGINATTGLLVGAVTLAVIVISAVIAVANALTG